MTKRTYLSLSIFGAALLVTATLTSFFSYTVKPTSPAQYARTTVMITRMDGRSGGTGVIYQSERNESTIITNAHVCGVVKNGGLVSNDETRGTVTSYRVSLTHDLCMIKTNVNFHVNTVVSQSEPDVYSEATVSGHPLLLPTIITKGTFSQKSIVQVMTGFRPCTDEDLNNPNTAPYCLFFGGIPVVKTYQAQVISATIQPGSSGSAVFNKSGEIAGLVFAGSGEIGYGMIVPQEYVSYFVNTEVEVLEVQKPNSELQFGSDSDKSNRNAKSICNKMSNNTNQDIENICNILKRDLLM